MIDGTYKIQMDSPVGAKEGTAVLITSGEKLTGSLTAMGVQIDIENGKVTDNSFTFGGKLESFVGPVIFAVGGSVEGDTIQGIAHIANRDFVFTGTRESQGSCVIPVSNIDKLIATWSNIFTSAWEQRKLGEVFSITMGQSPSSTNYTSNPDDYVLVQGNADLQNGWVYPRVWTTQVTKTADPGTLIMSVRAPVGAMGKTAYKIVLGRGVAGIQGPEILFQLFKKYESEGYWIKKSTGSTFDSINGDELKNTLVTLPNLSSEQTEIEKLLLRLDLLITLHQRKLK